MIRRATLSFPLWASRLIVICFGKIYERKGMFLSFFVSGNKNSRPGGGCSMEKWMEGCCLKYRRGRWDLTTSSSRPGRNGDWVLCVIVPDDLSFIEEISISSNGTLVWGGHVNEEVLSKGLREELTLIQRRSPTFYTFFHASSHQCIKILRTHAEGSPH